MLCLYDLDQFNGEVLIGILETHPLVLLAGMVMENPYYIEPDAILTVLGTPEAARFATSEAMRLIKLASAQSRLHTVLVLAMLMAECVEEDKIVQLGVTPFPRSRRVMPSASTWPTKAGDRPLDRPRARCAGHAHRPVDCARAARRAGDDRG